MTNVKINKRRSLKEREYDEGHAKKVLDGSDDKDSVRDWKLVNEKHKKIDEGERYKDKDFGEYDESEDGYGDTYEEK